LRRAAATDPESGLTRLDAAAMSVGFVVAAGKEKPPEGQASSSGGAVMKQSSLLENTQM
jgi:hypothetical protein